ncbi:MAG: HpcH/HpaI aldolase family protein [Actinomycetota bacterium]
MRDNDVKAKLQRGEVSVGTFVFEFSTTGIARLAASAGAEFIVYDMEHTGWTGETTRILLASTPKEIVPIVRVPANQYHLIAQQLDLGAMGIMVPMVGTADEARLLAESAKYTPVGRRGAAFGVAHDDYAGGDIGQKMTSANENVLTIAQIETTEGVENADEIAAVEGIDVIWLGQFDLTSFLGTPGRFDDQSFLDAVKHVRAAAERNRKPLAVLVLDVAEAKRWLAEGFTCVAYGGDLWLYKRALADGIAEVKRT